ncbi:MAG: aryl-sulfate sulfotransferase [Halanaerobiaceae bacterium]
MEGLNIYKSDKAYQGYTLFCEAFPEPKESNNLERYVYLVDMKGEIAHKWEVERSLQSYCKLLPDGNLIHPTRDRSEVARGKAGLYEVDPEGNIQWHLRCRTDHDFQILSSGNFLVHTITDNFASHLGPELKRQPYIIEVTPEKKLVWDWKGEEHFNELKEHLSGESWQHVLERIQGEFEFDWAHNNTTQVIPPNMTNQKEKSMGKYQIFKPGNIIISYRSLDVIAVIEKETGKIVWAWGPGILDGQHKPHMLENGNILIFDNGTLRGYSRVIEIDPLTEEIKWEYTAEPKEKFHSKYISGAQRLPNGNTLICEGSKAHLFEVTRDKEIVWDFVNPYHDKNNNKRAIYRCLRYSEDYVPSFLK